jgi:transposase InsO family protein
VDAWRIEYNTVRPYQALNMATSAERFTSVLDKIECEQKVTRAS